MPYDWAVQQLRLSLFASEAISLTEKDWKTITGQDEAENRTAIPGGKQYSGKFMGGTFAMGFAANRSDLILTYDDSTPDLTQEVFLPAIGKWAELSKSFATAVSPFLADVALPITRIAFGAILLLPSRTHEESYAKLDGLLPSVKVDPKGKELSYRINWPTPSKVIKGVELNRITAWASVNFTRMIMQVTGVNMTSAPVSNEHQFVRLDIDHNTPAGRTEPFEKAQRVPIFEELLALAQQNAEVGECK